MSEIRPATVDDLDRIMAMVRAFRSESSVAEQVPFYEPTTRKSFARLIDHHDACVLVAGDPAIGVLAGAAQASFWAPLLEAREIVFFVQPDHRGSKIALNLLEAWRAWGRRRGAAVIGMSVFGQRGALYQRRGFFPLETIWAELV